MRLLAFLRVCCGSLSTLDVNSTWHLKGGNAVSQSCLWLEGLTACRLTACRLTARRDPCLAVLDSWHLFCHVIPVFDYMIPVLQSKKTSTQLFARSSSFATSTTQMQRQ